MSLGDQADFLERLAVQLASLSDRLDAVERARLEAALTPQTIVARFGGSATPGAQAGTGSFANAPLVAPGAITGDEIAPNAIDFTKFAAGIVPPRVVTSLPTLPNASYPQGSLVFLTTDAKLYRNTNGSTWSKATDGADILANTITAGQIAAGAIGADQIAANAIRSSHLYVASDRLNLITNGSFEETSGTPAVYEYPTPLKGWFTTGGSTITTTNSLSVDAKSGSYVGLMKATGTPVAYQALGQNIPIKVGRKYRLSAWLWKGASGGTSMSVVAHAYDIDSALLQSNVISIGGTTATAPTFYEGTWEVPATISGTRPAFLGVRVQWGSPAPGTSEVFAVDDVWLEEVPTDVENLDGNVVIDSTGLTITNGKLTVTDADGFTRISGGKITAGSITAGTLAQKGANLIPNASFELGPNLGAYAPGFVPFGWDAATSNCVQQGTSTNAKTGTRALIVRGDGSTNYPAARVDIDVVPGKTYRFGGWMWSGTSGKTGTIRIDTLDKTGTVVTVAAGGGLSHATSTVTWKEGKYTIPSDGTVSKVRFYCYINATAPLTTDAFGFEDVLLEEIPDNARNADGNVVIDSTGITVTNGKITVSSDGGSSVVIDGTSNMFKIAATGTITRAWPAAGSSASSGTGGISGTGSSVLAHVFAMTTDVSLSSNYRVPGPDIITILNDGKIYSYLWGGVRITSSNNEAVLTTQSTLTKPTNNNASMRYYLMKEAAI